jgi:hypothetical protein
MLPSSYQDERMGPVREMRKVCINPAAFDVPFAGAAYRVHAGHMRDDSGFVSVQGAAEQRGGGAVQVRL